MGCRFVEARGVVVGWRSSWGGQPSSYGEWPAAELLCPDPRAVVERWADMLLKKGEKKVGGGDQIALVADDALILAYPVVWSFLTQSTWEDGTIRETGSLLVFAQDGMLKAMLRDKNDGTCLWVAGKGLTRLLDAIEGSLCDPGADWRLDRQAAGQQAKRVTKK